MTRTAFALILGSLWLGVAQPGSAQTVQDIWENAIGSRATGVLRIDPDAPPLDMSRNPIVPETRDMPNGSLAIGWSDLLPPHTSSETPFASLPDPLLEAMRTHIRWQTTRPQSRSDATLIAEHQAATALLASHQVDVDGLMKKRREIIARNGRIGRGPNTELVGKSVRLPGYIVPLVFNKSEVTEFLFVPVAGSCVHTPTPPANQIVHVRYHQGLAFTSIFDAFWIEGELMAEDTLSDVSFFDGAADVEAAYALIARSVERFETR